MYMRTDWDHRKKLSPFKRIVVIWTEWDSELVPFPFDGFAIEEDGGTTVDLIESSDMVLQPRQKKKQEAEEEKTEKGETGKKKSASNC